MLRREQQASFNDYQAISRLAQNLTGCVSLNTAQLEAPCRVALQCRLYSILSQVKRTKIEVTSSVTAYRGDYRLWASRLINPEALTSIRKPPQHVKVKAPVPRSGGSLNFMYAFHTPSHPKPKPGRNLCPNPNPNPRPTSEPETDYEPWNLGTLTQRGPVSDPDFDHDAWESLTLTLTT